MEGGRAEHSVDVMKSHPDRRLIDHLEGVKRRSLEKFRSLDLSWEELFGYDENVLEEFVSLLSESHDVGKSTIYFQKHLSGERVERSLSAHALFSAVAFFHRSKNLPDKLRIFGFEIIRRHHGDFRNFLDIEIDEKVLEKQFSAIPEDFLRRYDLHDLKLSETIERIKRSISKFSILGKKDLSDYFLIHLFMSILVSSDREDVVFKSEPLPSLPSYEKEKILSYREKLGRKNQIDSLRWKFQEEILNFKPERGRIYSITAPTGIGKTLANLLFAGHLADEDTIIIYALPFINIIEQTVDKIKEIFETEDPFFVLPFHHLANPVYEEADKYEDLLMNLWHSRVIVTTFVSLLESLITFRKIPFFYKFPKAVLILDEVQAIPHEYWTPVEKTVEFLSKMGTTVLLSTATKPALLKEALEVVSNKNVYFTALNRTVLKVEKEMSFEEYKEFVRETLKDGKRTLIITNTIREAEEIYDVVEGMGKTCFLSSRVIPKHRLEIVSKINEYDLCVSTQVVEAGVDISFERVIRDIAPVDSIVQAAGRCNRHFELEKGEVIVVPVKDERKNTLFSSYVYGSFLTETSMNVLKNHKFLEESEFFMLVEDFFSYVKTYGNPDKKGIGKALENLNFKKIGEFSLIEPEPTVPFIVLVDEEAQRVFEEFAEIFDGKKSRENFSLVKRLFRELSPYIVSARIKKDLSFPHTIAGMVVIYRNVLDKWYHPVKGLRVEGSDEVIII